MGVKSEIYNWLRYLCNFPVSRRIRKKTRRGDKIHCVFVCWRPSVWESLHSIYDAMKEDPEFEVTIVAIPNKKQLPELGLEHEIYESEGAEAFWKDYGCLEGYNYQTGEWLDLKSLHPDYVFFQQPYNSTHTRSYQSRYVANYAKLAFVTYFGFVTPDDMYDVCLPKDFIRDLSFFFTQNQEDQVYISGKLKEYGTHIGKAILTGFPRYDYAKTYIGSEYEQWLPKEQGRFRIIWTPRWTTNEGNCHFFDFKDRVVEYCKAHEDVDFVFRPHPQAFLEWNATGELPEEEAAEYRAIYAREDNMHLDASANYYPLLYSSDVLLTDRSSLIVDYLLTGKPIILCTSQGSHDRLELMDEACYKAADWEDVEEILSNLQHGEDPLKEVRKEVMKKEFYIPEEGAGNRIKDNIKMDAKGDRPWH